MKTDETEVMLSIGSDIAGCIFLGKVDYILMSKPMLKVNAHPLKVLFYVTEPMNVVMGEGKISQVLSKPSKDAICERAGIFPCDVEEKMRSSPYIYKVSRIKEYNDWKPPENYGVKSPRFFSYLTVKKKKKKKSVKQRKAL